MRKTIQQFADQLRVIRTGTISPGLVQAVRVTCAGNQVALGRLGVIKSQGDRILIEPFDRGNVAGIVKALNESRLSAYALNPTTVAVSVPPISVEQRAEIARHVKKLGEDAKIAVRAIRQQARKRIEATGRGSRQAVQDATDEAVEEIEGLVEAKLSELA
ncbi:MAG: ribosome-recycling factor [Isosphaeraceae bacterium]